MTSCHHGVCSMFVCIVSDDLVGKTNSSCTAHKPATACTMRVAVLGMSSAIIWGWLPQPTGSSDRRLQRTRTQCPAVLTRPLADLILTKISRLIGTHRGFRLSSETRRHRMILISAERQIMLKNTCISDRTAKTHVNGILQAWCKQVAQQAANNCKRQ